MKVLVAKSMQVSRSSNIRRTDWLAPNHFGIAICISENAVNKWLEKKFQECCCEAPGQKQVKYFVNKHLRGSLRIRYNTAESRKNPDGSIHWTLPTQQAYAQSRDWLRTKHIFCIEEQETAKHIQYVFFLAFGPTNPKVKDNNSIQ